MYTLVTVSSKFRHTQPGDTKIFEKLLGKKEVRQYNTSKTINFSRIQNRHGKSPITTII